MGWASATDLFDGAVDVSLTFVPPAYKMWGPTDDQTQAVVRAMYLKVDWDDWDTQDESKYFDPYLRDVMIECGEIDPNE